MDVAYETDERCGITLVELVLSNPAATTQRVRVASRLDGPVLPPRVEGYPAAGWDESGYEGDVDPRANLALGFACPAPAADPPVDVTVLDAPASDSADRSPTTILQALGDPRPPGAIGGGDSRRDPVVEVDAATGRDESMGSPGVADSEPGSVPPAIAAWFDAVATRLEAGDPVDEGRIGAVADRATKLHRRCRR